MIKQSKIAITLLLLLLFNVVFAEKGTLTGIISDSTSKENLIGVNITTSNNQGTVTDMDGKFSLQLEEGKYKITISYLGYSTVTEEVIIVANQTTELNLNLEIESKDALGSEIIVTSSLYQKRASEEVISVEVIKPKQLATSNILRIDEISRRGSWLNVEDLQENI